MIILYNLLSILIISIVASEPLPPPAVELVDNEGQLVNTYHGVVYENSKKILLTPEIHARVISGESYTGVICGFRILDEASPFQIEHLMNKGQGESKATIKVRDNVEISYNKAKKYEFKIVGRDCDNPAHESAPAVVYLRVEPYEQPKFTESPYSALLQEGQPIGTKVVQVTAHEATYEKQNRVLSSICKYEIEAPENSPFDIDGQGVIRTRSMIHLKKEHEKHYVLRVVAKDCMVPVPRESRVSVNIRVVGHCQLGWKNVLEEMAYRGGSGVHQFAEQTDFEWCASSCKPQRVAASISLTGMSGQVGQGCDRNSRSICAQRLQCHANKETVDLLATQGGRVKSLKNSCDHALDVDESLKLDGESTAVPIPDSVMSKDHLMGDKFTVGFWMKHKQWSRAKETVLCNSDGAKMNRHHYSVFVHNCKLILLYRKEFDKKSINIFKPAEWRYKLPQVCDDRWHHYSISYDNAAVKLYVDGHIFVAMGKNPQIVDDWPLHKTKSRNTKLTVGACWHAGQNRFSQFFKGELAGVSVLRNAVEQDAVVQCLNQCQEKIHFRAMNQMAPGMSVSLNSDMSMVLISGHNATEVGKLLRQVGYVNSKTSPAPGKRLLTLRTEITCSNSVMMKVPELKTVVLIKSAATNTPQPVTTAENAIPVDPAPVIRGGKIEIVLTADKELAYQSEGVLILGNLDIRMDNDRQQKISSLDTCVLRTNPELSGVESISWPQEQARLKGVHGLVNSMGLVMEGTASVEDYVQLARQIRYANSRVILTERSFVFTCSAASSQYVSNEFITKVRMVPRLETPPHHISAPHPIDNKLVHQVQMDMANRMQSAPLEHVAASGSSGVGVIVIVVICVGFLGFLIVMGLLRLRSMTQSSKRADHLNNNGNSNNSRVQLDTNEMEWDNTALNITINPLDNELLKETCSDEEDSMDEEEGLHDGLTNSSCSGASPMHHSALIASSEDEEDFEEDAASGNLEWDDSTMPAAMALRPNHLDV